MATNNLLCDEVISNRVMQEVRTPLGDVFVTYFNGKVDISFDGRLRGGYKCSFDEREMAMTVWQQD